MSLLIFHDRAARTCDERSAVAMGIVDSIGALPLQNDNEKAE